MDILDKGCDLPGAVSRSRCALPEISHQCGADDFHKRAISGEKDGGRPGILAQRRVVHRTQTGQRLARARHASDEADYTLVVSMSFSNAANDGVNRTRKIRRRGVRDFPDFVSGEDPLGGFNNIQARAITGSTPGLMIDRR
jgi:hypothetical protein